MPASRTLARPSRTLARVTEERLARAWEVWAAENLLRGKQPDAIAARLVAEGVSADHAAQLLEQLAGSAVYEAATSVARDARRWSAFTVLSARLRRDAANPTEIPRETAPSAERFYDLFYASGSPVVLEGLAHAAFELAHWSPRGLAARFGDVELEVTVDRDQDPDYGRTFHRRSKAMLLSTLVEHIEASANAPRNDVYVVAQNRVLERTAMKQLLDEIVFPPGWLDQERLRSGGASLWLGPAGTRTPLHHDHVNLLVCQLHGRKRWRLLAPTERAVLERVDGPYTLLDADELGGALVKEIIVSPGECLFVPAGWWHQVEALEGSTTLSISAFARDNDFALRDLTRR